MNAGPIVRPHDPRSISYSSGAKQSLILDYLPPVLERANAHVAGFICTVNATITSHASTDDEGDDFIAELVDHFRLYAKEGGDAVFDLPGYALRNVSMFLTGDAFDDPADIASGATDQERTASFYLPLKGGPGGVVGFKGAADLLQPALRFHRGQARVEVTWQAGFQGTGAIKSGTTPTMTITPVLEAISGPPVLGADFRVRVASVSEMQYARITTPGLLIGLAKVASDRDFSGTSKIAIRQHQIAGAYTPAQHVAQFNAVRRPVTKLDISDIDFVPLYYPSLNAGFVESGLQVTEGQLQVDLTATEVLTHNFLVAEVLDADALFERVPMGFASRSPIMSNPAGGLNDAKARKLRRFGPSRLVAG